MELTYNDGQGKRRAVAYEVASADDKSHTVCTKNRSEFVVHDSNLQLLNQPDFENIPKTPLDYRNEVGTDLTLPEAQSIERTTSLSPVQQELMIWHHILYHLLFRRIFQLASLRILPKQILECGAKPPM